MYEKDGVVYAGNPIPLLKIVSVKPLNDYRMRLEFSTGEIKEFDFTPLLDTPCFLPLRDKALFDKVYLDHGIPSWDGGNIDIAPEAFFGEDYWKPVLKTDLTAEEQAIIHAGDREFQEHPENFVPLESLNRGY